jgi:DNA-binding transcriptional ArsR family regulator
MADTAISLTEEQVTAIARALAEPRRMQMLKELGAGDGTLGCQCLLASQGISAATMSHHLKELEQAGLIHMVREGKFAKVTLRRDVLQAYSEALSAI